MVLRIVYTLYSILFCIQLVVVVVVRGPLGLSPGFMFCPLLIPGVQFRYGPCPAYHCIKLFKLYLAQKYIEPEEKYRGRGGRIQEKSKCQMTCGINI